MLSGKRPLYCQRQKLRHAQGGLADCAFAKERSDEATTEAVAKQPPTRRNRCRVETGIQFAKVKVVGVILAVHLLLARLFLRRQLSLAHLTACFRVWWIVDFFAFIIAHGRPSMHR